MKLCCHIFQVSLVRMAQEKERNSLCAFLYANRLFLPARACPVWSLKHIWFGCFFILDDIFRQRRLNQGKSVEITKHVYPNSEVQCRGQQCLNYRNMGWVILMQLRCSRSKSTIVAFEARVSRAFSKAGTYGRKCKKCNASGKSTWCHCIFQQV